MCVPKICRPCNQPKSEKPEQSLTPARARNVGAMAGGMRAIERRCFNSSPFLRGCYNIHAAFEVGYVALIHPTFEGML